MLTAAWSHLSALPALPLAYALWAGWLILILLLALWIDRRFGEPAAAWHPVVWMGNYLQVCGRALTPLSAAAAFAGGALAWCVGAAVVGLAGWALQYGTLWLVTRAATGGGGAAPACLVATLAAGLLLKTMLSWRMLRDEAGAVEAALQQSLAAGRERLSWLVSRDTTQLSASEVRESAIESLAENLNDSVVAPVFWLVLLGLPGAAVYRFANTADAMWGYRGTYRGERWEWAGKWAARADDVLSWVPARLTALLLALVSRPSLLPQLRGEARKTPSPNSGWPMAAMALALGVSLRKPGIYTLNPAGRAPEASDTVLAQEYASKVVAALIPCAGPAIVLIAWLVSVVT